MSAFLSNVCKEARIITLLIVTGIQYMCDSIFDSDSEAFSFEAHHSLFILSSF
jgi:hypothetical protein